MENMSFKVLTCCKAENLKSPVSWVLVAFVLFMTLRLAIPGSEILGDPDTFLHVAIGDWIRQHGVVPLTDPFSYPMSGQPWIAHEWLAGLVMSYAYSLGGWYGVCVLTVLSLGVTLVIIARFLMRHLPAAYAILFVVLALVGLESHLLARPHVLVWPLIAFWVGQLLIRSESGRAPPFWLLPLIVLWANLHGSFVLGLLFVLPLAMESWLNAALAARNRVLKSWSGFFVLALFACLITPFGWDGMAFAGKVVSMQTLAIVGEWKPLTVKEFPPVLIWLGLLLVMGLRGLLKLSWVRLVLLLGLGWQMLLHVRFYSLFVLLAPLLLAEPLALSKAKWQARTEPDSSLDGFFEWASAPSKPWAILLAGMVVCVMSYQLRQADLQPGPSIAPSNALQYLKKSALTGHGLNHYNYGGFLIWAGIPVFMDGRIDLRGDVVMKPYNNALNQADPKELTKFLDENQIAWTMFPPEGIPAINMDHMAGWSKAYADENAVIHVREKNN